MSLSIIFTVINMGDDLDAAGKREVARKKAAYHILHVRNNRTFIQATVEDAADIAILSAMLDAQGRNVIICGAWHQEGHQLGQERTWNSSTEEWDISGTPTYSINSSEIVSQQPDIVEVVGGVADIKRSLSAKDNFRLSGWANKNGL